MTWNYNGFSVGVHSVAENTKLVIISLQNWYCLTLSLYYNQYILLDLIIDVYCHVAVSHGMKSVVLIIDFAVLILANDDHFTHFKQLLQLIR